MTTRLRSLLALLAALLLAWAAPAAAADPSEPLAKRADDIVLLFNGKAEPEALFSPAFLAQVPPAQVKAVSSQLSASHGGARGVERIEPKGERAGTVWVEFERARVRLELAVAEAPPHHIEGLLVAGVEAKAEDVAGLFGELVGLPGEVSLMAARLEEAGPDAFLTEKADRPLAIGSAFKLFVLAELVRAVKAGEREWSDVVALDRRSLPSGILQDWPAGSPLTLHSLAALMISRSDNSATDTLIHALGRDKVEAMLATIVLAAAPRNRPFLTTREAFALKLGPEERLARWAAADEARRRAMLAELQGAAVDVSGLGAGPKAIDTVEWFASPADLVRTLDWLRRSGDQAALAILAINPGLGRAASEGFDYLGFKGGSEPGVINMSFLLRQKSGRWLALSVTWNNGGAPLDEGRFVALVARLVSMMRDPGGR